MARRSKERHEKEAHDHGSTKREGALSHALAERNLPALTRAMSFADMVQDNVKFRPILKDLRWLFPPLCQRKDQAVLTETERSRYICAFNMINSEIGRAHV